MKIIFALAAAASLVAPGVAFAQTSGSMGADAAGTGRTTLGSDTDPSPPEANMNKSLSNQAGSGGALTEGRASARDFGDMREGQSARTPAAH